MTFKTTTKKPIGSGSGGGDRIIEALKKRQEENKAKKQAKS